MRNLERRRRMLTVFVTAVGLATVLGIALVYPYGGPPEASQQGFGVGTEERSSGEITGIVDLADGGIQSDFLLPGSRELRVDVRLDDGRELTIETVDETGAFTVGQAVLVAQIATTGSEPLYAIVDFPRALPLTLLLVGFAAAVVALGRWQGVRALIGLGVSALLIVGVLIPALLAGTDGTLLALVVSLAVMYVTLPLSHGWSMTTRAAAAGTAVALAVTIGLAVVAVQGANLTGLSSEDVQLLRFATGTELDVRGLLLAGFIIGTLGVLDDVTVSQASTVAALRRANPAIGDREVFAEALRVGRDHIAATVNTLFLAYAGAALPLLILFTIGGAPISETLTSELVAQEIVRTIVGSLGLVLAVPLTTAIAAATIDASAPVTHDHGGVPPLVGAPAAAAVGVHTTVAGGHPAAGADDGTQPVDAAERPDGSPEGDDNAVAWEGSLREAYGLDTEPPEATDPTSG